MTAARRGILGYPPIVDNPWTVVGGEWLAGADHLWAACVGKLRDEFPDGTWNTWLAGARARDLDGHRLLVSVPSALAKERIEARHLERIQQVLAEVTGHPHQVVLEVYTDAAPDDGPPSPLPQASSAAKPRAGGHAGHGHAGDEPPGRQPAGRSHGNSTSCSGRRWRRSAGRAARR
jgi:hypothetical protein